MKATNITILQSEAFGKPDYEIVQSLLHMVDINMMTALGLPCFSTKQCVVIHTNNVPMCSNCGSLHHILLTAKDNYWCQWVYQFAHEYCHHLINGTLSGEWSDMLWFEETICELSSLYNLHKMIGFCLDHGLPDYALSVQAYLCNLLTKNCNVYNLNAGGNWYTKYEKTLSKNLYQRELYNAIAVLMFPLFCKNPNLWKIILNIGDIRSWNSLEELFEEFRTNADASYAHSLEKLLVMFN
jgi:hypothetical protein